HKTTSLALIGNESKRKNRFLQGALFVFDSRGISVCHLCFIIRKKSYAQTDRSPWIGVVRRRPFGSRRRQTSSNPLLRIAHVLRRAGQTGGAQRPLPKSYHADF